MSSWQPDRICKTPAFVAIYPCQVIDFAIYFEIKRLYVNFLHIITPVIVVLIIGCASAPNTSTADKALLRLQENAEEGTIAVFNADGDEPLLVQHARSGVRPYLHPIMAPDGNGTLTEFSPSHHKHQTGIYWGLKEVNGGRDYFMNWKEDYWRKVSANTIDTNGNTVKWNTVYDLLDASGEPILRETQTWSFSEVDGRYILNLQWEGEAIRDVTMGKFYVGGLFLRMPWRRGLPSAVVNAAGQRNGEAEGQRAIWNDIAVQVDGRTDLAHIAVLDHPDNSGFPTAWRVDNELGVGPSRQIIGDWTIPRGETEVVRYRLIVYTGARDEGFLQEQWKAYVCEPGNINP